MIYLLIAIFFIAKSEMNMIASSKEYLTFFPNWKWYITKDYTGSSWWLENPLAMFSNGWHFWEAITMIVASLFFGLLSENLWYALIAFIIGGAYLSIKNKSLFR